MPSYPRALKTSATSLSSIMVNGLAGSCCQKSLSPCRLRPSSTMQGQRALRMCCVHEPTLHTHCVSLVVALENSSMKSTRPQKRVVALLCGCSRGSLIVGSKSNRRALTALGKRTAEVLIGGLYRATRCGTKDEVETFSPNFRPSSVEKKWEGIQ